MMRSWRSALKSGLRLGLLPERFHFLEGGVGGLAAGFGQASLDMAEAALYLGDPAKSGYVTGEVLRVNGGSLI